MHHGMHLYKVHSWCWRFRNPLGPNLHKPGKLGSAHARRFGPRIVQTSPNLHFSGSACTTPLKAYHQAYCIFITTGRPLSVYLFLYWIFI
jgi:hypothetical protein